MFTQEFVSRLPKLEQAPREPVPATQVSATQVSAAPKRYAKQRRWRERQFEYGNCPRCGKPLANLRLCQECHEKRGGHVGPHHRRKHLTPDRVVEMRLRYAAGTESMYALARAFDTAQSNVYMILLGMTWKHVGGPRMAPSHLPVQ